MPTVALVVTAVALIPFVSLFVLAGGDSEGVWPHLARNVLPRSLGETFALLAGVGVVTSMVGITTAWLVARYRFAGRDFLHWALVLPLAIPTYLSAYCFVEIMDFTGPLQNGLRVLTGFSHPSQYWFPEIRSLPGAIFVMSAVLYPYVYLTCRLVFEMQGSTVIDTSRVLGASGWRQFVRVAAPLARPALVAGATLAMLEALNDIGAVEFLGVRTLTFSVFDTWLNRGSLAGAAQIALVMLVFVAVMMAAERKARGDRRYAPTRASGQSLTQARLSGPGAVLAFIACALPPIIGFGAPVALMIVRAARRLDQFADPALADAAFNSIMVSASAAVIAVAASFTVVAAQRATPGRLFSASLRLVTLGYAVPGSVLAIGTLFAFTRFDNGFDAFMRGHFGIATGLLLSGSAAIVIYAMAVRFLSIAHGSLESGYSRLSGHLAMASRTLGRSETGTLLAIEFPLLKRAFATAGLFVFVDAMKELSATILLRPFNFSTLATFVYEKASRALFEDATVAALAIVAIGMVPVILLSRMQRNPDRPV
ncbi:MAG: iron ABC transporter permease [Salaquimonas sp.]|nr:iron ABC transporter permease [Salaquimonas sp.]